MHIIAYGFSPSYEKKLFLKMARTIFIESIAKQSVRIYFLIFTGRNENSIINVIDVVYRYNGGAIFVHKKFIVENLNDERGVWVFNNLHGLCGVKIVRRTLVSGLMKNARVSLRINSGRFVPSERAQKLYKKKSLRRVERKLLFALLIRVSIRVSQNLEDTMRTE